MDHGRRGLISLCDEIDETISDRRTLLNNLRLR
jgi:hypothetical protein